MTVLKSFRVNQMHRADLENFRGEFKESCGWNPRRRGAFLRKLHPIIRRRTKLPIGSAVIKEDFEAIIPDKIKKKFGGSYGWCAHACLVKVLIWCKRSCRQRIAPIDWMFEAGTIGQTQVDAMFTELYGDSRQREAWRIGKWSFEKKDVVQLQAADVLAYELFKLVENQVIDKGEKYPIRLSMQGLMGPEDGQYLDCWDKERFEKWLEGHKSGIDAVMS
jgi:hypothetical protein